MEDTTSEQCSKDWKYYMGNWGGHCGGGTGWAIYILGFFGSFAYYLSTATNLLAGFIGLLKAVVWPAFLIYGVFKFLGL